MSNKLTNCKCKKKFTVYIILALATLAVYLQVYQFNFINYDDNIYITMNSRVQSGITVEGIRWSFGTKYFGLWNPLVWLSFMLDYLLYGLNAGGYHLTNLILHILSTLLLFWLFNRMTNALWKSAFVAALFALHSLYVESVAWIAERKDVLSAFFCMLTLCWYAYYAANPIIKRCFLVLFAFIMALMSKPMVVTLPVIMILLDYWPLKRFESQKGKANLILWQLKEKMPFVVLSTIIVIITIINPNKVDIPNVPDLKQYSYISQLANAPIAFLIYLLKTFWPVNMAIFYHFSTQIPVWQVIGSFLLILFITTIIIFMVKRMPYLFVGWLCYAITIIPAIGIIHIGFYAMADRYHYLPSIVIAIGLAWGIPLLFQNEIMHKKILLSVATVLLIIMSVFNMAAMPLLKRQHRFVQIRFACYKKNSPANYNLANALVERGTLYGKHKQYQLAINDFNEAIKLKPEYADAWSNRALVYSKMGNMENACRNAQKACEFGNCRTLNWVNDKGLCY